MFDIQQNSSNTAISKIRHWGYVKQIFLICKYIIVSECVEMMGLIGMGNNPMVGATVACAVAVYEAVK